MAPCIFCQSETDHRIDDVPICANCAGAKGIIAPAGQQIHPIQQADTGQQIHMLLLREAADATVRANDAKTAFFELMRKNPEGLPFGENGKLLVEASRELSAARKEMMTAQERLSRFTSGRNPDDLKRSG